MEAPPERVSLPESPGALPVPQGSRRTPRDIAIDVPIEACPPPPVAPLAGRPLLLLGMHRSGTSYLSSLLGAMGWKLGESLLGPQKGNPRGHFEDEEILAFHEDLLAARGESSGRWFDEGMMREGPVEMAFCAEEWERGQVLLKARALEGAWGWKEPRTCLFLDFWEALAPGLEGLIVFRHPLEIHLSTIRRDHWDLVWFPGQVLSSCGVYMEPLAERLEASPDRFAAVESHAAFEAEDELVAWLKERFGLSPEGTLPTYHAGEFHGVRLTPALHELTRLAAPQAVVAWERLAAGAAFRPQLATVVDPERERWLESLVEGMRPLAEAAGSGAADLLAPVLETAAGTHARSELRDEVTDYFATVRDWGQKMSDSWQRQADLLLRQQDQLMKIWEEHQKLSSSWGEQEEKFLKTWDELQKCGKSWEKQRDYIENRERDFKALEARCQELEKRIQEMGG